MSVVLSEKVADEMVGAVLVHVTVWFVGGMENPTLSEAFQVTVRVPDVADALPTKEQLVQELPLVSEPAVPVAPSAEAQVIVASILEVMAVERRETPVDLQASFVAEAGSAIVAVIGT